MITLPPMLTGGSQLTTRRWFPGDVMTVEGALANVDGITGSDGTDAYPLPAAFEAWTTKV